MDSITSAAYEDVLAELHGRNRVRVQHYRAISRPHARTIHRRVMDELSTTSVSTIHGATMYDSLRRLRGQRPIYIPEILRRLGGELVSVTDNLRTNVGIAFVAANLAGTDGGQIAVADWIALSNNTVSPAATDTSAVLPWSTAQSSDAAASGTTGEYTVLGVARKLATMVHSPSTATIYTATATWTATGIVTLLSKAGLFGGAGKTAQGSGSTNVLFLENTFTATSLALNDQLSLSWSVTI